MDILIIVLSSLFGLCLLLALLWLLVLVRPGSQRGIDPDLICDYAHRGLHGHGIPENSLAAFEAACEQGFGIELDVQLSRDGEVMVFHDYDLLRMTGDERKLCAVDAAELKGMHLNNTDQTIPTFCEVLSLINGRVPVLVELKGEEMNTALCPKVAEILAAYTGKYCIESFNPLLLHSMRKRLPNVLRGLLYTNVCRDKKKRSLVNMGLTVMAFNVLARPHFIAFNYADRNALPTKITTRLYGAPRFTWTPKGEKDIQIARKEGHVIFERD